MAYSSHKRTTLSLDNLNAKLPQNATMNALDQANSWPEPIIRVRPLSQTNLLTIPSRFVQPPSNRPSNQINTNVTVIPVIDLANLDERTLGEMAAACRDWGFFQVVNHGVGREVVEGAKEAWREFFKLPEEVKRVYGNSPETYEGYGSRVGVEKDAVLDWNDYYFLHYLPLSLKDCNKWPALPLNCRQVVDEYGKELTKLSEKILKAFSVNLGLEGNRLQDAFGGGNDVGACLRTTYYPKCPQPELALGLSPHSDPGGLTVLSADDWISGLQVRKDDQWVNVVPAPNAFIVNIGDQIQVLSNGIYKSVEHRVIVNSFEERLSLAFFYNPNNDIPIMPLKELVTDQTPALYPSMTFGQYRLFIRTHGPRGKSYVDSLEAATST